MSKLILSITMLLLGLLVGYFFSQSLLSREPSESLAPKVLYWVAPMDDSYRRDKPGKSPMGMDLVAIYEPPSEQLKKSAGEKEILYWVAPMDDNFRRDKPGKSPMGMDLVPVYADNSNIDVAQGTVNISAQVQNNIGVRSESVLYGPLQQQLDTVGYVSFDQDKLWHVYPRVEGWVEHLMVSASGDKVTKGAELFSIYSPTLVNAQEEFLIALKRGDKSIISSAKHRLSALGISAQQIEQVQKQRQAHQLVIIYAHFSGYLTALNIREGQYISPTDKVLSLADISTVWVMTEIFERQAAWLSHGLLATMTTTYMPGITWQGSLAHIHPFLNEKTRTMRVRLHFDNSDEVLKPNMFVKVAIQSRGSDDVISIPREALIRTGKQDRVVLALGEGNFRSVAVLVGREAGERIEIIKGLSVDAKVVTSAQFLLDSESSTKADFSRMQVEDTQNDHQQMEH